MTPEQYCQDKAAPYGSDLYFALYFADPDKRPGLLALYALYAELTQIVREVSDKGVARMKLQWWREELGQALDGRAQHPVTQALAAHVYPALAEAPEYIEQMLEGVGKDLEFGLYPSFKELSTYCHQTGGAVTHLAVRLCGHSDPGAPRFAHDVGMGLQLGALLSRLRPDLDAGRLYIPEDELHAAGLERGKLLSAEASDKIRPLLAQQAQRAEDFLASALERLAVADYPAQRSQLILIALQRAQMKEIEADNYPLLERSIHLTPIRKLWIAWRTARKAKRGKGDTNDRR